MNLIDAGTTYYAFHNNLDVAEAGILANAEKIATDLAIAVHLGFSLLIMGFCFWLNFKINNTTTTKKYLHLLFFIMLIIWTIFDTGVAINNILVILSVT